MSGHTSRHLCILCCETRIGRLSKQTRDTTGTPIVAPMIVDEYVAASDTFAPATPKRGTKLISFEFTSDQIAFQQTLADFSRKVLLPGYRDRAASTEFPFELLRQLGDLGVLGIGLPEKYGGTGAEDPVTLGLATETLAYGDVNVASAPVQIGLIGSQLMHGTEEV